MERQRLWRAYWGEADVVSLLQETLNEEKETDQKLTELAQSEVNVAAQAGT
jgi:ferritin-like metal-binding protein YciE